MEYQKTLKRHYHSTEAGEPVAVMLYKSESNTPYIECTKCGKSIRRTMYVIQSEKTDIELFYLGSDCYKKFK